MCYTAVPSPLTAAPVLDVGDPNVFTSVGQPTTLVCEVSGTPAPTIKWSHEGKPLDDERFLVLADHSLFIQNTSLEVSLSSSLSVRPFSSFLPPFPLKLSTLHMFCVSLLSNQGHFSWSIFDKQFSCDSCHLPLSLSVSVRPAFVSFNPLLTHPSPQDEGSYLVTAENSTGTTSAQIKVTVIKPTPPERESAPDNHRSIT